jgi:hypothetical protein
VNDPWADTKVSGLLSENLLSKDEFRFSIGITPLLAEDFFANHGDEEILRERQRVLREHSTDHVCALERIDHWQTLVSAVRQWDPSVSTETIQALAGTWEPDFVLLEKKEPNPVLGGCVCFPSGWSLPEKVGRSLFATHAPVPGLNEKLASGISRIVSRLDRTRCFQRANWGLTGSRALDQHPHRRIQPIDRDTDPTKVDLRIEWQALIGLPNDLVLFGIRVFHVPLSRIRMTALLSERLAENLITMPPAVAEYKRLSACRDRLVRYLRPAIGTP